MNKNIYNIYKISDYNVKREDYDDLKKTGDINTILKLLEKNKSYHLKIDDDKPCKFYGDFDHCSEPTIFFDFIKQLCSIVEVDVNDVSYTESLNNKQEWSYHYVIPSLETTPKKLKYFFNNKYKKQFELYKKENQLDTSVYNNILFRLPNQTNKAKLNSHEIKNGKMEDFIIDYVDNCDYDLEIDITEEPTPKHDDNKVIENNISIKNIDIVLSYLTSYDDREHWIKCGMALKNLLPRDDSLSKFIEWSKQSAKFKNDDDCIKTFNSFVNDGSLKLGSLIYMVKECNSENYNEMMKEIKQQFIKLEILDKGSNDVALYISEKLKTDLVYCNDSWMMYDKISGLWRIVKRPDAMIISHLQKEIDFARENILNQKNKTDNLDLKLKFEKQDLAYLNHYKEVCNGSYVSQLIKFLTDYLYDNLFYERLDNYKYKIAYKNGIFDLTLLEFTEGIKQEHYLTKTLPFDYKKANEKDIEFVRTQLKKTCNWNDSHLEYYLSILGYAMTGDSDKEQMFYYLLGQTAENGKSIIFEVLEKIMPNYVQKATSNVLDKGVDLKKEIPTWKGLLILWLNEVSTKQKDEDLVKATCDGTDMKYNRNYATEAQKCKINFKLFAVSNNSLTIKGDAGIQRRFKLLQFNSQFRELNTADDFQQLQFKKDKTLAEKLCNEYKHALLHLIFSYSKMYYDEKQLKYYPIEWQKEANENLQDNNKFESFFNENFVIGQNYKISKTDLDHYIPIEFKETKIKDELKRMKIPFTYDSQMRLKNQKGFFIGFQINDNDDDDKNSLDV